MSALHTGHVKVAEYCWQDVTHWERDRSEKEWPQDVTTAFSCYPNISVCLRATPV
jgi:hypothetical protein